MLFLPPTAGQSREGAVLEDVVFMRDDMANIAWAIERSIESAVEQPPSTPRRRPRRVLRPPMQGGALRMRWRPRMERERFNFLMPL